MLRDPGVNAGYWNLAGRALAEGPAGPTIDGRPLRGFHFSGFDPELLLAEAHDTPGPPSPWDDRAAFSNWVAAKR